MALLGVTAVSCGAGAVLSGCGRSWLELIGSDGSWLDLLGTQIIRTSVTKYKYSNSACYRVELK